MTVKNVHNSYNSMKVSLSHQSFGRVALVVGYMT